MSTAYYVETIERITEQMLEEEVLAETEAIRIDSNSIVNKTMQEALDYIAKEKHDLAVKLGESELRKTLKDLDSQTTATYNKLLKVISDTEEKIENNVRQMIVDNGYSIEIVNDGNGNVTTNLRQVV